MKRKQISVSEETFTVLSELRQGTPWDDYMVTLVNSPETDQANATDPLDCDPLDSDPTEYFKTTKDDSREIIADKLGGLTFTPKKLLSLASGLSGMSEDMIIRQAVETLSQKMITTYLCSNSKPGALGSADQRIKECISEQLTRLVSGDIPTLTQTKIAGRDGTNPKTLKNFLHRYNLTSVFQKPLSLDPNYGSGQNHYTTEKHALIANCDWIDPDTVKALGKHIVDATQDN